MSVILPTGNPSSIPLMSSFLLKGVLFMVTGDEWGIKFAEDDLDDDEKLTDSDKEEL